MTLVAPATMVCYSDRMRLGVLAVTLLAGCPMGGGSGSGECLNDRDCASGEVCARDSVCTPASSVREVTTTWTVGGAAASTTTCATHPDLFINFIGRDVGDSLGYAPVPCRIGQFFVDKLPERFRQVEVGVEGGISRTANITSAGTATVDLP